MGSIISSTPLLPPRAHLIYTDAPPLIIRSNYRGARKHTPFALHNCNTEFQICASRIALHLMNDSFQICHNIFDPNMTAKNTQKGGENRKKVTGSHDQMIAELRYRQENSKKWHQIRVRKTVGNRSANRGNRSYQSGPVAVSGPDPWLPIGCHR
jgi:hypothetical protein